MKNNNYLTNWLKNNNISYTLNFELKKKSWLKAGGTAEVCINPESAEDTIKVIKFLINEQINFYPIGNLSNTLFRDGIIKTPLINLKRLKSPINKIDEQNMNSLKFKVSSGLTIFKFVTYLQKNYSLSGLEGLIGIPGTIGGAIYTNASSYGSCISDYLFKIEFIDKNGDIKVIKKKEIKFGWRKSIFQEIKNFLILNVYFEFPKSNIRNSIEIDKKVEKIKHHREKFQESNLPNLGSLYASKNLYKDLSKLSIILFILYLIYILGTKITYLFFEDKKLLVFRKYISKLYCIYFGIDSSNYSLSIKTINCLVNIGSDKSSSAFDLVEKLEKKIKKRVNLENILLKDIK